MSLTSGTPSIDQIIDRRRIRRKLTFWRVAAFVTLAGLLIALMNLAGAFSSITPVKPHIARVAITGVITEDLKLIDLLDDIGKDDTVKGVILTIDSPGGTTVGGEAIYGAVRKLAEKKPVTAQVGTLAASAGYMIATATDHIVARHTSIVGSIGVLFQYPQATELLDKIGVKVKEIKSAPLKAEPSPFNATPPEAEVMIKRLIDDSYDWFVGLVTERRPLSRAEVLRLADGSIYSGNQGLANKLVDAIGGEEEAKNWLVEKKGLDKDLKVLEWKVKQERSSLFFSSTLMRWVGESLGLETESNALEKFRKVIPDRLFLDGLLSIWHG